MSDGFKALADPTRRVICKLLKEKDLTAGEIAASFSMSKPAISKHLDILKNAGLIDCVKEGQFVRYSINTSNLQNLVGGFLNFFDGKAEVTSLEKQKR